MKQKHCKKLSLTFAVLMGAFMSLVIVFFLTFINEGFSFSTYILNWVVAYLIVIPTIILIAPRMRKLAETLSKEKSQFIYKLVFSIVMGFAMTGIVTFFTLLIKAGLSFDVKLWITNWSIAYIVAIPLIYFMAPLMQRLTQSVIYLIFK